MIIESIEPCRAGPLSPIDPGTRGSAPAVPGITPHGYRHPLSPGTPGISGLREIARTPSCHHHPPTPIPGPSPTGLPSFTDSDVVSEGSHPHSGILPEGGRTGLIADVVRTLDPTPVTRLARWPRWQRGRSWLRWRIGASKGDVDLAEMEAMIEVVEGS